tara:strand:+ start:3570 stop:4151 length:582 start_codon:yes stop_codon:yes gene_type:complete
MKTEFVTTNENTNFLKDAFPDVKFEFYKANIPEIDTSKAFFTAFVCHINTEHTLAKVWRRINNLIGAEYQSKLNEEFSSWNIYVVFLVKEPVSNIEKYKIENDTFFVRKLVCDNLKDSFMSFTTTEFLNNIIFGADIDPINDNQSTQLSKFQYSDVGERLLNEKLPFSKAPNDKSLRTTWLSKEISRIESNEV